MQKFSRLSVFPGALLAMFSSAWAHEADSVRTAEQESLLYFSPLPEYRSVDGTGNNQQNPEWGSHGDLLNRLGAARYARSRR
jgi:hypothetical protein